MVATGNVIIAELGALFCVFLFDGLDVLDALDEFASIRRLDAGDDQRDRFVILLGHFAFDGATILERQHRFTSRMGQ